MRYYINKSVLSISLTSITSDTTEKARKGKRDISIYKYEDRKRTREKGRFELEVMYSYMRLGLFVALCRVVLPPPPVEMLLFSEKGFFLIREGPRLPPPVVPAVWRLTGP